MASLGSFTRAIGGAVGRAGSGLVQERAQLPPVAPVGVQCLSMYTIAAYTTSSLESISLLNLSLNSFIFKSNISLYSCLIVLSFSSQLTSSCRSRLTSNYKVGVASNAAIISPTAFIIHVAIPPRIFFSLLAEASAMMWSLYLSQVQSIRL